jgi:hypothetical protein
MLKFKYLYKYLSEYIAILSILLIFCYFLPNANAGKTSMPHPLEAVDGKIGIFDLKVIRAVPLDAEVISKVEEKDIVIEKIRFTSRPGVRTFMIMTYPKGLTSRPVNINIRNYGVTALRLEAKNTFVGLSVCPPSGNTDATKELTLGGPPFNQFYTDNPEQSWYYHYVVALTRAIDYLSTRKEADMKNIMVAGFSTSGYVGNLLHAIENRPVCYYTWHSTGHYTAPDGLSGGKPGIITRKQYEMYGPAAYAKYGSSPIYVATAMNDYYAVFDGVVEFYSNLRCPKGLALAPNRGHAETERNELKSQGNWCAYWQFQQTAMPTVNDGVVTVRDGHLIYSFNIDSSEEPTRTEILYSYGQPGDWIGRTWHRLAATKLKKYKYEVIIPVYDPTVPLYVAAQVETPTTGVMANLPQYIEPTKIGITMADTEYPHMLLDFENKCDLYITVGKPAFVTDDPPQGKISAAITLFADNTAQIVNIEPKLWKNAKELHFFLKGDGKPGPIDVYLTNDRNHWDFPKISLIQPDEIFEEGWKDYMIPLDSIANYQDLNTLVFALPGRQVLNIDAVCWK